MNSTVSIIVLVGAIFGLVLFASRLLAKSKVPLPEVARLVAEDKAIFVDVREPDEWSSGVAQGARLLPMSDLRGARKLWNPLLTAENKERTFFLYCASGARSGMSASTLRSLGFNAENIGGFSSWKSVGLPVTRP